MKILAVGNSFSEDATAYLKQICDSAGVPVMVVNLFIGGCSLAKHADNIRQDVKDYYYQLNGVYANRKVSVSDVIREDDWDVVTMQQCSSQSGEWGSYNEDATFVADYLRSNAPQAKLYFHQTWAYETDSTHGGFAKYGFSQEQMHQSIVKAVASFCAENGHIPIIPCGELIAELRKTAAFNYANGGESLCRDGFHSSLTYGRYALALMWYKFLLNGDLQKCVFVPRGGLNILSQAVPEDFVAQDSKIQLIKDMVEKTAIKYRRT